MPQPDAVPDLPRKRIAIFCDGTWNTPDGGEPTNVLKLAQAVLPLAPDGIVQQTFYYPGVGTGRGTGWLARTIDRTWGAATGSGLDEIITEAFRALVFAYRPGDEIYIFGFSRGAFTARSLAGLIRKAGIPARSQVAAIPEALRQYRLRGQDNHPDAEAQLRFRAHLSPATATSPEDLAWRARHNYMPAELLTIRYLGVWDTVGGLGLPGVLGWLARAYNRRYRFHDLVLSRSVGAARHALALDELRKLYPYTPWSNLAALNQDAGGRGQPYRQLWFPGNHSIVGGSGPVQPLSAFTLDWVRQGAGELGLAFDEAELADVTDFADATATDAPLTQRRGLSNLFGLLLAPRDLAPTNGSMAPVVAARQAGVRDYLPQAYWHNGHPDGHGP